MNVEALQALAGVQASSATSLEGPGRGMAAAQGTPQSFGAMVSDGLSRLNGELLASQADMQGLAVGNVQNLHQVMIRMEESRLSFELMLHVRNRVLEAYQDLMKMQV